jgi:ATP-binding protein involved in chromosome partitioning
LIVSSNINTDLVVEALKEVMVPGTKVDIIKLNLVGEVKVNGGEVAISVVRTTEKPETIDAIRQAVGDKISALPGVLGVQVTVDDRSEPKRSGPHGHSNDPFADRARLPGVKRIIAVASAKGGVGKSSVAVNLALALKENGARVGLMDADVYGPSVPTMLAVTGQPEVDGDKKIKPFQSHGLQVMSMGLLMPPDQPVIWRGPLVMSAVKQFLQDVLWNDLDYLVIDMPPGTGDAQLTLVQTVPLSGVVMVTTPQEVALADVRRGIQMFAKIEVPVLGIVENMSYFVCPDNDKKYDIFGHGGGAQVAKQYNLPLLGEIPIDPAIRMGGDTGKPAVEIAGSATRQAFLDLARKVSELAVDPA